MAIDLSGIAEWLHGWFPYHTEVVAKNQTSANASKNVVTDSSGEVTTENKISVGSNGGLSMSNANVLSHSNSVTGGELTTATLKKIKYDGQGHITGTANVTSSDLPTHEQSATSIIDGNAHSNIGTNAQARQGVINTAIDTAIGSLDGRIDSLEGVDFVKVVSEKPTTPSADTMNILWVVANGNSYDIWITVNNNSTYSWDKIDENILDDLSIDWSEIENNPFSSSTPSSFANATHTHVATAITDLNAHSNIGSGANTTQGTINTKIDTAIGNKASSDHRHGELTNGGQIYTTEYITANDGIVITDYSDDNKLKRTTQLFASHIKDGHAHNNIGTTATATQDAINSGIDTALGNKLSATKVTSWSSTTSDSNVPSEKLVKDSLDGKADKSGGVQQITDANAHSYINTSANATQGTINTAINNAFTTLNGWVGQLSDRIDSRKVYFVSTLPYLGTDDADIYGIYVLKNNDGDLEFYGWKAGREGVLGDYGSWELLGTIRNSITSISLVPKSSDSSGAIRLYYGDET